MRNLLSGPGAGRKSNGGGRVTDRSPPLTIARTGAFGNHLPPRAALGSAERGGSRIGAGRCRALFHALLGEGAEHVVVAGGGAVLGDQRPRDPYCAGRDVDPAADPRTARPPGEGGAAEGPVAGHLRVLDADHPAREVQGPAQGLTAHRTGAPEGLVVREGAPEDRQPGGP